MRDPKNEKSKNLRNSKTSTNENLVVKNEKLVVKNEKLVVKNEKLVVKNEKTHICKKRLFEKITRGDRP